MTDRTQHNIELLRRAVKLGLNNIVEGPEHLDRYIREIILTPPEDFEINPLLLTPINDYLINDTFQPRRFPSTVATNLGHFLFCYRDYERESRKEDTSTPTGIFSLMCNKIGHGRKSLDKLVDALVLPGHESLITLARAINSGSRLSKGIGNKFTVRFMDQFTEDYSKGLADITDKRYELCKSLVQRGVAFNREVEQIGFDLITRLIEDPKFDVNAHLDTSQIQGYEPFLTPSFVDEIKINLHNQKKGFYPYSNGAYQEGYYEKVVELDRGMPIKYLQKESELIGEGLKTIQAIIEDLSKEFRQADYMGENEEINYYK